jgi:hypothetical protein
MNTLILLQICLVAHLIGLTLMAGTTAAECITFKTFRKMPDNEKDKAMGLLKLMEKLSSLMSLGAALLVISGTGLLVITGGVFFHQFWFKVKLVLIVMLILNGFLVGGRQHAILKKTISENGGYFTGKLTAVISNLRVFYGVQMAIFCIIIMLAVFKFS